jgi:hypothetical protein
MLWRRSWAELGLRSSAAARHLDGVAKPRSRAEAHAARRAGHGRAELGRSPAFARPRPRFRLLSMPKSRAKR